MLRIAAWLQAPNKGLDFYHYVACVFFALQRLTQFTDAVETLANKLSTEFREYMEGMGAGGEIVLVVQDGEGEHRVKRPIKDWEMQPHVRFRCVYVEVATCHVRVAVSYVCWLSLPCAQQGTRLVCVVGHEEQRRRTRCLDHHVSDGAAGSQLGPCPHCRRDQPGMRDGFGARLEVQSWC